MVPVEKSFREKAPAIMVRLMGDFGLTPEQAAGILGNLGVESGLRAIQELHPISGRGGFGWAQWTGPRRKAFEGYCSSRGLDIRSDAANYAYLWRELSGNQPGFNYSYAIDLLKKTKTLKAATETFEAAYEKAGKPNMPARLKWAQIALDAYGESSHGDETVKAIQDRLIALGADPGPVDGIIGPLTLKAILGVLNRK